MAAQFAKNLKKKLAGFAGARPIRVVNSTRAEFDAESEIVICHGKKFVKDFRVHHENVNKIVISQKILNESCVIVLAKNIVEVMDYTQVDTETDFQACATRLGRTIAMYGFSDKSMCTVCLDEGVDNRDVAVCPHCQACVCIPCFARCVRARIDPEEVFPNEFKCPTCNSLDFACDLVGKTIKLRPAENRKANIWEVLDATCFENDFKCPELFLDHPNLPFRYSARISVEGSLARIDTMDPSKVVKMATTEGSFICIGDLPRNCACGGGGARPMGFNTLNGKAFVYTNSNFVEIRNGFPLVLSWLWNE
jgi:hypothetical protein